MHTVVSTDLSYSALNMKISKHDEPSPKKSTCVGLSRMFGACPSQVQSNHVKNVYANLTHVSSKINLESHPRLRSVALSLSVHVSKPLFFLRKLFFRPVANRVTSPREETQNSLLYVTLPAEKGHAQSSIRQGKVMGHDESVHGGLRRTHFSVRFHVDQRLHGRLDWL